MSDGTVKELNTPIGTTGAAQIIPTTNSKYEAALCEATVLVLTEMDSTYRWNRLG